MNHDVTGGAMFRQPPPGFEGEVQEPDVAPMNQPGLPMAAVGRVGLSAQCARKIGKVERHHRP